MARYLFSLLEHCATVQCTNCISYTCINYTPLAEASAEAQTCTLAHCVACRKSGWIVAWLRKVTTKL